MIHKGLKNYAYQSVLGKYIKDYISLNQFAP